MLKWMHDVSKETESHKVLMTEAHLIAFIERSADNLSAQCARAAHNQHRVLGHCARAVLGQLRCCYHPCDAEPLRPPACCTQTQR